MREVLVVSKTSLGMQYWQRKLQRSVTLMRKSLRGLLSWSVIKPLAKMGEVGTKGLAWRVRSSCSGMIRSDIGLYFAPLIDMAVWVQTLTSRLLRVLHKKRRSMLDLLCQVFKRTPGFTWLQVVQLQRVQGVQGVQL